MEKVSEAFFFFFLPLAWGDLGALLGLCGGKGSAARACAFEASAGPSAGALERTTATPMTLRGGLTGTRMFPWVAAPRTLEDRPPCAGTKTLFRRLLLALMPAELGGADSSDPEEACLSDAPSAAAADTGAASFVTTCRPGRFDATDPAKRLSRPKAVAAPPCPADGDSGDLCCWLEGPPNSRLRLLARCPSVPRSGVSRDA